jgi:hypothetical protein
MYMPEEFGSLPVSPTTITTLLFCNKAKNSSLAANAGSRDLAANMF